MTIIHRRKTITRFSYVPGRGLAFRPVLDPFSESEVARPADPELPPDDPPDRPDADPDPAEPLRPDTYPRPFTT